MSLFVFARAKREREQLLEELTPDEMAQATGAGGPIVTYQVICRDRCWETSTGGYSCLTECEPVPYDWDI